MKWQNLPYLSPNKTKSSLETPDPEIQINKYFPKLRFDHSHKGEEKVKKKIVQLYSPSSTTLTEHVTTPTKIETWKWRRQSADFQIQKNLTGRGFDFLWTLVAPASRLLETSSSTTLAMSNMIIPERMEWRTPSGNGLIVFISELPDRITGETIR